MQALVAAKAEATAKREEKRIFFCWIFLWSGLRGSQCRRVIQSMLKKRCYQNALGFLYSFLLIRFLRPFSILLVDGRLTGNADHVLAAVSLRWGTREAWSSPTSFHYGIDHTSYSPKPMYQHPAETDLAKVIKIRLPA